MDKCCGAIVIFNNKYLLVKAREKDGGHWNFPKGHVEDGETEEETALREIKEEVGLEVEFVKSFRDVNIYYDHINKVDKQVVFFLAKAKSDKVVLQESEVAGFEWLEFDDAVAKVTHDDARETLQKAHVFVLANTTSS
jgi:bis(5'-nucleosidyl)-tetraphosphatase